MVVYILYSSDGFLTETIGVYKKEDEAILFKNLKHAYFINQKLLCMFDPIKFFIIEEFEIGNTKRISKKTYNTSGEIKTD